MYYRDRSEDVHFLSEVRGIDVRAVEVADTGCEDARASPLMQGSVDGDRVCVKG